MKKLLLLCLTALFALTTWAADFFDETSGFYYNIVDGGVEVTWGGSNQYTKTPEYTGDLIIPLSVLYEGNTYYVIAIGDHAFNACDITSLEIPNTVTTIGKCGICNCSNLTSLELPNSITTIEMEAFESDAALEEINIPESVTSIGDYAFMGCGSLKSLVLPNSVTVIGEMTCASCISLKEVTIGNEVTSIGDQAFRMCVNMYDFTSLNPEPPSCGTDCFQFVSTSVATLHVPMDCVKAYSTADTWKDFGTFQEIDETITPPTVTTIAVTDITNSTATLHGTVSAGSEEILERGFQYWADANARQTIVATSISGEEISSTIQRLSSATDYTFRTYARTDNGYTYGEEITFTTTNYDFAEENSEGATIYYKILSSSGTNRTCEVQYLYYMSEDNIVAYEGELTIPETVTHEGTTYNVIQINEYAFYECRNLRKVIIPECVTAIGPNSFQNCTSLEEATFPNTVSTMWEYTFKGCTSLKEAIIPSSVTTVRQRAFQGCTSLEEIIFPSSVETFQGGIFEDCTGLKKATLEEGLTNMGTNYMFAGCTSLEEVSLPNTMTEIATYTFRDCTSLEKITLPNSVTSLGSYVFYRCSNLKSCVYSNSMTDTGGGTFYECGNFEDVTFSRNITKISGGTFTYCNFDKMEIPEGVTTIGSLSFGEESRLETITFPKTVTTIDYQVCYKCPNLSTIFSLNPTPPTLEISATNVRGWFEGINDDCMLYVPAGSRGEYASATGWKDFGSIVEIDVLSAETSETTNITETSATLNGSVIKGTFDVIGKGFEYWTNPIEATIVAVEGDDFTTTLSDLESGTTYYYRAYATDTTGTTYGETLTFTTEDDIPDGIDSIGMSSTNSENIEGIYSTSGQKLNSTVKGVNIIRYSDGSTKKVIMK